MEFSSNRLSLLAGLGTEEMRHEIVREQAEALNESAKRSQEKEDEDQVRSAVRRTIRKMISEGTLSLDELNFLPGRAMEEAAVEDEDMSDEDHAERDAARKAVQDNPVTKALKDVLDSESDELESTQESCKDTHLSGPLPEEEELLGDLLEDDDELYEGDYVEVIGEQDEAEHSIMWKGTKYVPEK